MSTSIPDCTTAVRPQKGASSAGPSYNAARTGVALFDLGQEGRFRISGPGHLRALNGVVTADLDRLMPYRGLVGLFLRGDAELVAIGVVFRGVDHALVFTEPDTADTLYRHLRETVEGEFVRIDDLRRSHAYLSLVGPMALEAAVDAAGDDILGLVYFSSDDNVAFGGHVFRFGFSGEFEYRFLVANDAAPVARNQLLTEASPYGVVEADAAVVPALMFEMRSIQFRDVPEGKSVLEAGMHWMIDFPKSDLPSGAELARMKTSIGRRGLMVEFSHDGRAAEDSRLTIEGEDVGELVRVEYSPMRGGDIGLAYVNSNIACVGVAFHVDGAGGPITARGISGPTVLTRSMATLSADNEDPVS